MLSFSVSKATFDISKANNPTNLRDQCDYCNNPQPRFYENPYLQAHPKFKHIAYKQCLPGCVGSPDVEVKIADTSLTSTEKKRFTIQIIHRVNLMMVQTKTKSRTLEIH